MSHALMSSLQRLASNNRPLSPSPQANAASHVPATDLLHIDDARTSAERSRSTSAAAKAIHSNDGGLQTRTAPAGPAERGGRHRRAERGAWMPSTSFARRIRDGIPGGGGPLATTTAVGGGGATGGGLGESRSRRARSLCGCTGVAVGATPAAVGGPRRVGDGGDGSSRPPNSCSQLPFTAARPRPARDGPAAARARPTRRGPCRGRRGLAVVSGEYGGGARGGVRGGGGEALEALEALLLSTKRPPPRARGSARRARVRAGPRPGARARRASRSSLSLSQPGRSEPMSSSTRRGVRGGRSADEDEGGGDSLGNPRVGPSEESDFKRAPPLRASSLTLPRASTNDAARATRARHHPRPSYATDTARDERLPRRASHGAVQDAPPRTLPEGVL